MARAGKVIIWSMVALVLTGGTGVALRWGQRWLSRWTGGDANASKPRAVESFTVKRGELKVVFVEAGKLRAVKNHNLYPQVTQQATDYLL